MMKLDPRPSVIGDRLAGVKRIIAVTGWKGGIGKSVTASALALLLARKGFRTGLADLDFCGASAHVVLGAHDAFPREELGLLPPEVAGVRFMSVSFFSGGSAVPLRGEAISGTVLEMLAVTLWGDLDFLVIDMPPGINDVALDVIRLMPGAEVLAVTTPSVMAKSVLTRSLELYESLGVPLLGVVENMCGRPRRRGAAGAIGFDPGLEKALGDPAKVLGTAFASDLEKIADRILKIRKPR